VQVTEQANAMAEQNQCGENDDDFWTIERMTAAETSGTPAPLPHAMEGTNHFDAALQEVKAKEELLKVWEDRIKEIDDFYI
jgi:hypothetical protein